ncbi:uncharacterized protein LOC115959761 isoform X2 [Quercus lobata]|uniref:uncharacterized protein LOC115959761 isoform X2 n=1 Tax=Quercus lobata TaxID=97700 RepID=UPI0012467C6B|nr:uncharacterized protein LOC115959761 isoform X2 [Quercus lobata]
MERELQQMRVLVGAPLRQPPKHQIVADPLMPLFSSIDSDAAHLNHENTSGSFHDEKIIRPEGLNDFFVFCTSDFATVSKEVHVRTRRVRLLGLEGAGKTSLLKAILSQSRVNTNAYVENMLPESDDQEGIAGGLCYCVSAGDLNREVSRKSKVEDKVVGLRSTCMYNLELKKSSGPGILTLIILLGHA